MTTTDSLDLSGQTVLVADDVTYSRSIVRWLLRDFGDPKVHQAANGKEALGYLSFGVDVVISDFNMPKMQGLELLKAVRTGQHDIDRATPFAMLTAYSDEHLVDLALALDVNAFLIKPVSKQALATRLEGMLQQSKSGEWLKSAEEYGDIDVAWVLDDTESGPKSGGRGRAAASVFRRTADVALLRETRPSQFGASPDTKHSIDDTVDHPDELRCSINEIPKNAMLSRDINTSNGLVFMKRGSRLTPRVVSLLTDLERLRSPVDSIWIKKSD